MKSVIDSCPWDPVTFIYCVQKFSCILFWSFLDDCDRSVNWSVKTVSTHDAAKSRHLNSRARQKHWNGSRGIHREVTSLVAEMNCRFLRRNYVFYQFGLRNFYLCIRQTFLVPQSLRHDVMSPWNIGPMARSFKAVHAAGYCTWKGAALSE